MSQKFVQTQAVALYTGMSGAATSCIITPYPRDIQTNAKLVFADFGSTPTFTVDPKIPGYEEICSFTGITDNGDDTATLTGLARNLIGQYPYTTPGTGKQHGSSAVVVFSDNPQMYARLASLENDNVFTGVNEGVPPTTSLGFVTRDYMLALINGGAISINAMIEAGTAGETIATGNLIYFDETQNEWMKCDADTLATVMNVKLGIAQGAGTDGNSITGGVLTRGSYTTSGLTKGDLVYASNTAGGWNSGTSGTVPRVIGIASSTTVLYFDPYFQNTLYNYAVDAVGTDDYAVTLAGALGVVYTGMQVVFKAGTANTGACTLAINGGSAKAIKKGGASALETGDILSGQAILVEYDGTNFQLLSAFSFLASATVAGRVEEATAVEANAGTAAGGTGAQLYLNPAILPAKNIMGMLGNAMAKTWFNCQLLFILWVGATNGDATTSFANWTRNSTDVSVQSGGSMITFGGSGADYIYTTNGIFWHNKGNIQFSGSEKIVIDWLAQLNATATGDVHMGISQDPASAFVAAYNATTWDKVCFAQKSTGELYAVTCRAGGSTTTTDISAGLTLSNYNNFRIEFDFGSEARFYVNGVLKATISGSTLPNAATTPLLGFGRSNSANFDITAPNVAIQLI